MKNVPSLIDVQKEFGTVEQCISYLVAMRWPKGVQCVECYSEKVSKLFTTKEGTRKRKNAKGEIVEVRVPARHLFTCLECKVQFSPTAGTIFHDTHLPLTTWFMACALMCNAKKGVSAKQLERDLGVTYRTAWYLAHRIRKAMEDGAPGLLSGVVEADETYIGGRLDKRRKRLRYDKQPVFGALQRGVDGQPSKVRAFPVDRSTEKVLIGAVRNTIKPEGTILMTDEARSYQRVGREFDAHETVTHIAMEYVRKGDPRMVTTNSIENFWSLFKRGLIGSYHQVSVKHLRRYLDEFTFRFNNRKNEEMFALAMLNLVITRGVKYAELTAKTEEQVKREQALKMRDLQWPGPDDPRRF